MATVEVTFTPLPAHVRTARLVATAVARRSGVDESLLDEVRLAVGEACSRAVEAHRRHCPAEPVKIEVKYAGPPALPAGHFQCGRRPVGAQGKYAQQRLAIKVLAKVLHQRHGVRVRPVQVL